MNIDNWYLLPLTAVQNLSRPLNPVDDPRSVHPAPGLLSIDVHWNRGQSDRNRSTTNNIESLPYTLRSQPVVRVECHAEREHILDEVHDSKCFSTLFTMAVTDVCYYAGSAELYTQVDETHADDDWDRPGLLAVKRFAPGEEAGGGEDEICEHDGETKFRFWCRC